jgi:hypothetical protein
MFAYGLPVLTDFCPFRDLSVGEHFYFVSNSTRYEKISATQCRPFDASGLQGQHSAPRDCNPRLVVWRRIEP